MIYGYARVSSETQSYDGQLEALKAAGCPEELCRQIYRRVGRRPQTAAGHARQGLRGDVVVATKIDRFARSTLVLLTMLKDLEARGVGFKSLGDPMIDTTSAHGELLLTMLGPLPRSSAG
jgi:DNA invertase Pin-like site-specific DNA recombinase